MADGMDIFKRRLSDEELAATFGADINTAELPSTGTDIFTRKLSDQELAQAFGVPAPEPVEVPFRRGMSSEPQVTSIENEGVANEGTALKTEGEDNKQPTKSKYQQLLDRLGELESGLGDRIRGARDRDAQIALINNLNKAFSQAGASIANRSGMTNLKGTDLDLESNLEKSESNLARQEINSLLARAKRLQPEDQSLTPYQQATLELQRQKLAKSDEYLADRKEREKRIANQQQINTIRQFLKDDPTYAQTSKQMLEFEQVGDIINQAEDGNQAAVAALGTKLARAMGEVGVLTDTDVVRYVQGTSWGRKLQDWAKRGFEGELSEDTLEDIRSNIGTIEKKLKQNKQKVFKRAASRTKAAYPNLEEETISGILGFPLEETKERPQSEGPYGNEVEKDGKMYKWNATAGKYQLLKGK